MSNQPRIYHQFDRDLEDGLRVLSSLAAVEKRMRDRMPTLAAASYDTERSGAIAWCDTHEREVTACRRKRLLCRGVPLPKITDQTGDAAISAVYEHAWAMGDYAEMVHVAIDGMLAICRIYATDEDPAAGRISEDVEEENRPKCVVHARYGFLTDARGKEPTVVKHKGEACLDVPVRLCEWCEKQVRSIKVETGQGRLPNRSEVTRHGRRIGLPSCIAPEPRHGDADDIALYAHAG